MVSSMSNDILTKRTGYCFLFFGNIICQLSFLSNHCTRAICIDPLVYNIHVYVSPYDERKNIEYYAKKFWCFSCLSFFSFFSGIESSYRKVSYSIFLILNQLQALKNRKLVLRHEACIIYKKLSKKVFFFQFVNFWWLKYVATFSDILCL